jgi:hypothetical protein
MKISLFPTFFLNNKDKYAFSQASEGYETSPTLLICLFFIVGIYSIFFFFRKIVSTFFVKDRENPFNFRLNAITR